MKLVDKVIFVEYLIRVYGHVGVDWNTGKKVKVTGGSGGPWPAVSIAFRYRLTVAYIQLDRLAARLVTVNYYW